jgi:tetratricopeptide (TPR) repeat protein
MAASTGRNERCPCGSGRKFKQCHGSARPASPPSLDTGLKAHLIGLVNQNRLREAEAAAREALLTHGEAGFLWKVLSVALVRQSKQALPELRRAAELLPGDVEALSNLGSALHERGEWSAALPYLQHTLRLAPDNPDVLLEAADCLRGLGRAREAVAVYERAVSADPTSAVAHNNFGNALVELGDYDGALRCFRIALNSRPKDAQVLCNLSNCLLHSGRIEEAFAAGQQATVSAPRLAAAHRCVGLALAALGRYADSLDSLRGAQQIDPTDAETLNGLGKVLRDTGDVRQALAIYRRAVELEPNKPEYCCNLGNALFEARQVDAAVVQYRQALALRSDFAPAHLGLALAFRQQRRPLDAHSSCRAALEIEPGHVAALSLLGELEADDGRFDEAGKLFHQALHITPDFVPAIAGLATHRKLTDDDADWSGHVQALLAKSLPVGDEIALRFALGKYFDDREQYDQAFSEYRQANDLAKVRGNSYEPMSVTRRFDRIIGIFDAAYNRRIGPIESNSTVPVFIIGMPRSGTSLAEQILASHPDIFGAGEVVFWNAACDAFLEAEVRGESTRDLIRRFAGDYLTQVKTLCTNAIRTVDKMPGNFLYAGLIHAVFPHARIIHMMRHPIDTCLSIYFQNFYNIGAYGNDLEAMAHYYGEYLRIMRHWRSVIPPSALLEISYEHLVSDQELWTRRMLDFIGVPWNPRCLDFHRTERAVITASRWQVRQKIHTRSTARWRHYEKHVSALLPLLSDAGAPGPDVKAATSGK